MTEDTRTVTADVVTEPELNEEENEYSIDRPTEAEDYTPTEDEGASTDAPSENPQDVISYKQDLCELAGVFSELESLSDIEEIREYDKYKRFRDLGLSPKEAYLATGEPQPKRRATPTSPISVRRPVSAMPESELRMAREIFSDLSDREITILYRMVTK